jgi:thymidylate synthase
MEPGYDAPNRGIRYEYGDLNDVVEMLATEPDTRQAYLPIFFPEDTGMRNPTRKPCTLGYHFILRHGYFHITYYMRSCDFYRHFRDDCYLTVRLHLWVLDRLRKADPATWGNVKLGFYIMHITSLHMFTNDLRLLKQDKR